MTKRSTEHVASITRTVTLEWPAFTKKLTSVLCGLKDEEFLILQEKGTSHVVQFSEQGAEGVRIETTSNAYLKGAERLNRKQVAALKEAGWLPPTGSPEEATPEKDPDGSPNFFVQYPKRCSRKAAADLAVHTLTDILHILHPGWLEYDAFNFDGKLIDLPVLGLDRMIRDVTIDPVVRIKQCVQDAIREETGLSDLEFDKDGEISLRYDSAAILIELIFRPPYLVRFISPLLRDVRETSELASRLNQMNADGDLMRFYTRNQTVVAVADIPADPVSLDQIRRMIGYFSSTVDGVNSLLQKDFGGCTAHETTVPSLLKH